MADIDPPTSITEPNDIAPLPYKLATIITLGVWLWGVNLYGLGRKNIDVPSLIKYPGRNSHSEAPHHRSVWNFATALLYILGPSTLLFLLATRNQPQAILYEALPHLTLFLIGAAFLIPARLLRRPELFPTGGRSRFLGTLRRVSIGGLARTEDGKFGDVLLADALTSYARPLSELYIAIIALLWRQTTRASSHHLLVPLIYAAPFAMRLRQCLTDRQFANAAKYATAFPVVFLSYFMKSHTALLGIDLHALWLLAALLNAMYSFYWDVARDWDLTLFSDARLSAECTFHLPIPAITIYPRQELTCRSREKIDPYGLRRTRLFPSSFYYAMILTDLVLRFAWALKLSPHLEHFYDIEGVIFLLELLEVGRRFLWVFFRVETEWIRTRGAMAVVGLEGDALSLGDLGAKADEEEEVTF
nr:protein erd1 like 1 [Quercus suber]